MKRVDGPLGDPCRIIVTKCPYLTGVKAKVVSESGDNLNVDILSVNDIGRAHV